MPGGDYVQRRRQCSDESPRRPRHELEPLRRSPPTIHTMEGSVHVCGQCLRPGHRADGCRRAIVYRRCTGIGYHAHQCRNPRVTDQQLLALGSPRRQDEVEQIEKKMNEEKQTPEGGDDWSKLKNTMNNLKKRPRVTPEEEHTPQGHREVKYNAARKLQQEGVLHLPKFSLSFEPWTSDLWVMEKAGGERRWVTIRHLLIHRWDQESVPLLLKPIGDLIYVNERGVEAIELVWAVVRIQRG
ncbi:hypothetical protein J5N97_028524 [Dioscorea zingiberensis]|uniref:DUF4283 domain-containing protein n=1 Tax=Dioscorea zingiberensis TaxID=325984 RepID=A0A9D5BZJ5_9LILI|nr:hypothetical protein J5N97_028524 [Dioscorea zingiberensis]